MIFSFRKATYKNIALTLALMVAFSLGLSGFAHAEKGGHGNKGKDHDGSVVEIGHDQSHDDSRVTIKIGDNDRNIILGYLGDDLRRHCPPGLAKKRNGCLPPGQAKKYVIGQRLPDDVVWVPIPDDLRVHLKPLPVGYQYVQVDKDILLIGEATKKIIDAVTLMSVVGN